MLNKNNHKEELNQKNIIPNSFEHFVVTKGETLKQV